MWNECTYDEFHAAQRDHSQLPRSTRNVAIAEVVRKLNSRRGTPAIPANRCTNHVLAGHVDFGLGDHSDGVAEDLNGATDPLPFRACRRNRIVRRGCRSCARRCPRCRINHRDGRAHRDVGRFDSRACEIENRRRRFDHGARGTTRLDGTRDERRPGFRLYGDTPAGRAVGLDQFRSRKPVVTT